MITKPRRWTLRGLCFILCSLQLTYIVIVFDWLQLIVLDWLVLDWLVLDTLVPRYSN